MQSKVNVILSVLLLVFFIPATLGFALINHHCTGCQSHDQETVFLVTAHTHDDTSCFCTEASASEASHDCDDQHADDCNGEYAPVKHTHDCVVELKKLDEPFTPVSPDKWLPTPFQFTFAYLFFTLDQIPAEAYTKQSSPLAFSPPRIQSGYERLIMNEVFRLWCPFVDAKWPVMAIQQ